jgi:hypothetical protein
MRSFIPDTPPAKERDRQKGELLPTYRTEWNVSRSLRLHAACQRVQRVTEATLRRFAAIQQEFAL